jgi:hypothetical protein
VSSDYILCISKINDRNKIRSRKEEPPITGVGEDAGKKEPSYTVGGNVD